MRARCQGFAHQVLFRWVQPNQSYDGVSVFIAHCFCPLQRPTAIRPNQYGQTSRGVVGQCSHKDTILNLAYLFRWCETSVSYAHSFSIHIRTCRSDNVVRCTSPVDAIQVKLLRLCVLEASTAHISLPRATRFKQVRYLGKLRFREAPCQWDFRPEPEICWSCL